MKKSLKRRVADAAAGGLAGVLNAAGSLPALRKLMLLAAPRVRFGVAEASWDGTTVRFQTSNEMTLFRVETLLTKEPETLAWIKTFEPGSVLYDIGANVGTYTVCAAASGRAGRVLAFEPEAKNFAILNRNIGLNGLDDRVQALNVAFSDKTEAGYLHLSSADAGGANNTFGEALDPERRPTTALFRQGVLSFSLDDFLARFSPPFPNHIKIDVDGLEPEIVRGARKTLGDPRVRSLLVEINEGSPEQLDAVSVLEKLGFRAERKPHAEMFEQGQYARFYNYIFRRP